MSAEIEHLRAVGRAATEGPWECEGYIVHQADARHGEVVLGAGVLVADARFAATARNEWDALLDELAALRRWKAEALPVIAGLQDLGRALGLQPGTTITGPAAAAVAAGLRDEVEALRAKVARVEEINLRNAASAGAEALRADRAEAKVERVEALATAKEDDIAQVNATPDPLAGRHSTMRAFVLTTELRVALGEEGAPEGRGGEGCPA